MSSPTDRPATWFVTGASRGLGLAVVTALLDRGDRVAATTRSADRLRGALPEGTDTRPWDTSAPKLTPSAVAGGI